MRHMGARSIWAVSQLASVLVLDEIGRQEKRCVKEVNRMSIGPRIAVPLGFAVAMAIAAVAIAPRAYEAQWLLAARDDPALLADHAVTRSFTATTAEREINAALAVNDADLAKSFLDLARDHNVTVAPALSERVDAAVAEATSTARSLESFARGFITGEPQDISGLAGTAVGDLFVFGDIRDAVREGTRLATGQETNELILGLACVGLAVTAGTYATLGLAAPARVGLTVVKAAGKTGRIGGRMMAWIGRSLREIVDWGAISRAARGVGTAEPVMAVRAAREAVKVEKARDLVRLAGDVGRVQARAGTQAALDGLKIAEGPRDMSRIARLAATKGGKTRAILKLVGRGAILLTFGTFQLAMWLLWALLTIIGFASALKRMTERATERYCARRKLRRARALAQHEQHERERCAREQRLAALTSSAEEPTAIYSTGHQELGVAAARLATTSLAATRLASTRVALPSSERADAPAVRHLPRAPQLVPKLDKPDRAGASRRSGATLTIVSRNETDVGLDRLERAVASLRGIVAKSA
jgi:hypothetical protein